MPDTLGLVLAWAAGGAIGTMFFGGLWWTVGKALSSRRPALWVFLSLQLRMIVALAGFYFVSGHRWDRLLLCLVGFVMARFVVTRLTWLPAARQTSHAREPRHAP